MKRAAGRTPLSATVALLVASALVPSLSSCKKKPAAPPPPPEVQTQPERGPEPAPKPVVQEEVREAPIQPIVEKAPDETELDDTLRRQNQSREFLRTIYFDFDKSELRDDQVADLQSNAEWLKANPQFRVLVEGHADERDTIEYNLALGDRRARSVMQYLVDLGVAPDRLRTISYGEERPVDTGQDEEAWARNRRAEFTLER